MFEHVRVQIFPSLLSNWLHLEDLTFMAGNVRPQMPNVPVATAQMPQQPSGTSLAGLKSARKLPRRV